MKRLARRDLLGGLLKTGLTLTAMPLLAACAAQAPTPTTAPTVTPVAAPKPTEAPAAKPTAVASPVTNTKGGSMTYWNGLTGADGKSMDGLVARFTSDTGIAVEQQRIGWADLLAKVQVAVPAGEGPDLLMLYVEPLPSVAAAGLIEELDEKSVADRGFTKTDFVEATWDGGAYQGKRYGLPLAAGQLTMYLNNKVFKDAGVELKPPKTRVELFEVAKQLNKGDVFGMSLNTGIVGAWQFQQCLWQNDHNVFTSDLQKSALVDPKAIEVAQFWGSVFNQLKLAPPAGTNVQTAFIAGKVGIWLTGNWMIPAFLEAKTEFTTAPTPVLFKQPGIWTSPFEYCFPKVAKLDQAKRELAWAHIRWMNDHVADWALEVRHIPASKKALNDPRLVNDPILKVLVEQTASWRVSQPTPKWGSMTTLMTPVVDSIYTGQKAPQQAMEELSKQVDAIKA